MLSLFSAAKSCCAYLRQVAGCVLLAFCTSLSRPKAENSGSKSWFWGKDTSAGWLVFLLALLYNGVECQLSPTLKLNRK